MGDSGGPTDHGPTTEPAERSWYKKKRYIVPLGVVATLILIGLLAPGEEEDSEEVAVGSDRTAIAEVNETTRAERTTTEMPTSSAAPTSTAAKSTTTEISTTAAAKNTTTEISTTTAAPPPPDTTAAPTTAPPTTESAETAGERNARRKAEDYLAFTAFSRSGLIEQLEFEGFMREQAIYGVDAMDVDWNEQAAKKAEDYLSFSAFSRSGLIEQLEFEGFTRSEAEYGVSTTGL